MRKLSEIIRVNGLDCSIEKPTILLKKRNGDVIGKIAYSNLHMSISGTELNEISFDIYKDTEPLFDSVIDLKICHIVGFGKYEIKINKTCETTIMKTVSGISLEAELAQAKLYECHINDDDYLNVDYALDSDFDANGNIIPIKFWKPEDTAHSLLHIILADKAPHWSYNKVTQYITEINMGDKKKILSSDFQRTFTFDGTDILSAMSEIAKECNVIFSFDTENRKIDVYDKFELGEDTNVLINRRNLASNIQIDDLKDEVKNCFRVTGGDDVINNMIPAINITGNYIYDLNYQYEDMPDDLVQAFKDYLELKEELSDKYYGGYDVYELLAKKTGVDAIPKYMGSLASKSSLPAVSSSNIGHYYYTVDDKEYYISNGKEWEIAGAFVRYCAATDWYYYYNDSMAPTVTMKETTATKEAANIINEFTTTNVGISGKYSSSSFDGITNNVIAYIKLIVDSRYTVENLTKIGEYPTYNPSSNIWNGKIHIYKTSDTNDTCETNITVKITNDELTFAKQKIYKSMANDSIYEVDRYISEAGLDANYSSLYNYFIKYNLTRLEEFYKGFDACVTTLESYKASTDSAVYDDIYNAYKLRTRVVKDCYTVREKDVNNAQSDITKYQAEINKIQEQADFKKFLDNIDIRYWSLFNSYRREDTYQNDNYISDGLSDGEILAKCYELLAVAQYQLSIACKLQHTLSVSISNLLIMKEFEKFWDSFDIYNYIRVQEDDDTEPMKLQLLSVDLDFDTPENININFATNISGSGNILNDLESVIEQSMSIGSSYSSTVQQASQGKDAKSVVSEWISEGLSMAQTQVKNAVNEEVIINESGLLARSETDSGIYAPFQTKLVGQGLFFTDDSWDTVSTALGRIWVYNRNTKHYEWSTGLVANKVIGSLIAGNELYIGNSNGSVEITGDTAKFTNININYNNTSLNNYVKIGSSTSRAFEIGTISSYGNYTVDVPKLYFDTSTNALTLTGSIISSNIYGSYIANNSSDNPSFYLNGNDGTIFGSHIINQGFFDNYQGFKTEIVKDGIDFYTYYDQSEYGFMGHLGSTKFLQSTGYSRWGTDEDCLDSLSYNIEYNTRCIVLGCRVNETDDFYSVGYLLNNYANPEINYGDTYSDYRLAYGDISARNIFYGNIYNVGIYYGNTSHYIDINQETKSSGDSDKVNEGPYPVTYALSTNGQIHSYTYTGNRLTLITNMGFSKSSGSGYIYSKNKSHLINDTLFWAGRTNQMCIFKIYDPFNPEKDSTMSGSPYVCSRHLYVSGSADTYYTGLIRLFAVWGSAYIETLYTDSGEISGSDRRKKNTISELNKSETAEFIYSLKPSEFKYNHGSSGRFHHGLIAQEVKESMGDKDWGLYIDDGELNEDGTGGLSLRYTELIADLIATVQSQNERILELENRIKGE